MREQGIKKRRTIAGRGPRTGKIRTRKLLIACNSSTLPFWNSSSGRGRSPRSERGFSVEYYAIKICQQYIALRDSSMRELTTTGTPCETPSIRLRQADFISQVSVRHERVRILTISVELDGREDLRKLSRYRYERKRNKSVPIVRRILKPSRVELT